MLSRYFAFACVAVVGISLPGAKALAQETPQIIGLLPSLEETQQEFLDFARSVAITGRSALVSVPDFGRVAIYTPDEDGTWSRTGEIAQYVSAMTIHGKRLAVTTGSNTVRLFERQGSQFQPQSTIGLPPGATLEYPALMGYDGETLAFTRIQAEIDPVLGYLVPRYNVVVYRIGPRGKATLVRTIRGPLNEFIGRALAVRDDTLVVADNYDGAAYVYQRSQDGWRFEQRLSFAGNPQFNGVRAVAIRGRHILAGVPGDESIPTNGDGSPTSAAISGAVYVFTKSQGLWRQTQRVRPDYTDPQVGAFSAFGGSLAVGGKRVAIGAPNPLDNDNGLLGQTYVYRWDGDTLVFDLHLAITGTTLSMTPRRLVIGTHTVDSHANPITGATLVDFGDRDPTDEDSEDGTEDD